MNEVVVIGEAGRVTGFALAGAHVVVAGGESEVAAAWDTLGEGVAMIVLTPTAASVLAGRLEERPDLLVAVLP